MNYSVYIIREKNIPTGKRHFYHPVSVAELRNCGLEYNVQFSSNDETVYLDDESYKNFMVWQYVNVGRIDNKRNVEEIDYTIKKLK